MRHIRFSADERAPEHLYVCIVKAVDHARTRATRIRLAISSLFVASSTAGSILAVRATVRAASESGFTSFASLALSDTSIIARHAQEFFLSLIETLPGVEIALALLGISIFLVSLRSFIRTLSRSADAPILPLIRHT